MSHSERLQGLDNVEAVTSALAMTGEAGALLLHVGHEYPIDATAPRTLHVASAMGEQQRNRAAHGRMLRVVPRPLDRQFSPSIAHVARILPELLSRRHAAAIAVVVVANCAWQRGVGDSLGDRRATRQLTIPEPGAQPILDSAHARDGVPRGAVTEIRVQPSPVVTTPGSRFYRAGGRRRDRADRAAGHTPAGPAPIAMIEASSPNEDPSFQPLARERAAGISERLRCGAFQRPTATRSILVSERAQASRFGSCKGPPSGRDLN